MIVFGVLEIFVLVLVIMAVAPIFIWALSKYIQFIGRFWDRLFSKPMEKPKGFTLIELMIIISIVAILAAIAVPNCQRMMDKNYKPPTMKGKLEECRSLCHDSYLFDTSDWKCSCKGDSK